MPADLTPTPGYLAVNDHPWGLTAAEVEQAAWRATEVYRMSVEPGMVLLCVAPPSRPGDAPILIFAHDSRDGSGTYLRGAWRLGPGATTDPVRNFSRLIGNFGRHLEHGRHTSLFLPYVPGPVPPQPTGSPVDVELHALPQTRQFVGMHGWALCFGIDLTKYRRYLTSVSSL